jgi:hypothetical protein
MELAGLEPATSWVRWRSYHLSPRYLQGFYARLAWKTGPEIMRNLQEFFGVPSRERARVMKFGALLGSGVGGRGAGSSRGLPSLFGSARGAEGRPVASGKIAPVGPLLEDLSQFAMVVGLADPGERSGRVDWTPGGKRGHGGKGKLRRADVYATELDD